MNQPITSAALRAIRRILRAADRGGRRLAAVTGLTPSQLLALQEIERRGETTPSELATRLQFGQATVTNIVDRLHELHMVTRQRSSRDKRQIMLGVTQAGRDVLEAAPDLLQQRFSERYEGLPPWEQAMILAALERLSDLLDASDMDAAPLIDTGVIDRTEEHPATRGARRTPR
jgi:DNA-binding MarR family transcriptional regulator